MATRFPNKDIAFLEASFSKRKNKRGIFDDNDIRSFAELVDLDGDLLVGCGWSVGGDHVVSLDMLDLLPLLRCQGNLIDEVKA